MAQSVSYHCHQPTECNSGQSSLSRGRSNQGALIPRVSLSTPTSHFLLVWWQLQDGPLDPVPEEDNQYTGDSKQSLSVPDEGQTEDDQPVDVTPHYSLRDHSTIVPPARLMTTAQNELLPGRGGE